MDAILISLSISVPIIAIGVGFYIWIRRTETLGLRTSSAPQRRRAFEFAVLALAGIPGYLCCVAAHTCMAGHMKHPPYAAWNFAVDLWWAAMFLCAAISVWRSDVKHRHVLAVVLAVLVLGGLSIGNFAMLDIVAIIWLGIVAARTIHRHRRSISREVSPS